jgi:predicted alpha/beta hydrolase
MTDAKNTVRILARDGFALAGDLHRPSGGVRAAALIAPAMGVPRRYYGAFAAHLAEEGIATLTFDYRGIGDSGSPDLAVRLPEWGELDLDAAIRHLRSEFPEAPLLYVGHSVGGQLMGLLRNPPITAALFVASQSGYWKNWDGAARVAMFAFWHAVIPASVRVLGRLPMRALGQGEDVPGGVARDWARWGRHPEYIMSYARGREALAFSTYAGPLRTYSISDDGYAPKRSIEALAKFYERASVELRVVKPSELGLRKLGHFGPFMRTARSTLWMEMREWLLDRVQRDPETKNNPNTLSNPEKLRASN